MAGMADSETQLHEKRSVVRPKKKTVHRTGGDGTKSISRTPQRALAVHSRSTASGGTTASSTVVSSAAPRAAGTPAQASTAPPQTHVKKSQQHAAAGQRSVSPQTSDASQDLAHSRHPLIAARTAPAHVARSGAVGVGPAIAGAAAGQSGDALLEELCAEEGPKPIAEAEKRGMSLGQLVGLVRLLRRYCTAEGAISDWVDVDEDDSSKLGQPVKIQSGNLYHLSKHLLAPAAAKWSCSLVEVMCTRPEEQAPEYFVSHWWGQPFVHLVMCLQAISKARRLTRAVFWVCAFANGQPNPRSALAADLVNDSSFRRALASTKGTVLALDVHGHLFDRIWCFFEIFTTLQDPEKTFDMATFIPGEGDGAMPEAQTEEWRLLEAGSMAQEVFFVPGGRTALLTDGCIPDDYELSEAQERKHLEPADLKATRESRFPLSLAWHGYYADLEHSHATEDEDRTHLLNLIVGAAELDAPLPNHHHPGCIRVNRVIRSRVAVATFEQAVKAKDLKKVDRAIEVICDDDDRLELEVHVPGLRFTDDMFRNLAVHLNCHVQRLSLILDDTLVTDNISEYLRQSLRRLKDLKRFNLHMNNTSLARISSPVPAAVGVGICSLRSLTCLELWFTNTPVADPGVVDLAHGLVSLTTLTRFVLGLGFSRITDRSVAAVSAAAAHSSGMREMRWNFNNTWITSEAASEVAHAITLMRHLSCLFLNFQHTLVRNVGAVEIYRSSVTLVDLEFLELDFAHSRVNEALNSATTLEHVRSFAAVDPDAFDDAHAAHHRARSFDDSKAAGEAERGRRRCCGRRRRRRNRNSDADIVDSKV